jgi:hypothetical protein
MVSEAGAEVLKGPRDLAKAKRLIEEAGYHGERVVLLEPTDSAQVHALALVTRSPAPGYSASNRFSMSRLAPCNDVNSAASRLAFTPATSIGQQLRRGFQNGAYAACVGIRDDPGTRCRFCDDPIKRSWSIR